MQVLLVALPLHAIAAKCLQQHQCWCSVPQVLTVAHCHGAMCEEAAGLCCCGMCRRSMFSESTGQLSLAIVCPSACLYMTVDAMANIAAWLQFGNDSACLLVTGQKSEDGML